ncbi:pyridoxal phosphate-dependent transferase [Apodospora peruviana]|uniref:Pyridoxal phosphate-dependent transferase n=1 Tax=Apodospora peruviana TaxID=516989 RepID=A0AAE0IK38_9PEZI|nr:pyridoxal phosphate-dependent transferase [Apodospora peruviana]
MATLTSKDHSTFLSQSYARLREAVSARDDSTIPLPSSLSQAISSLPIASDTPKLHHHHDHQDGDDHSDEENPLLPRRGLGLDATVTHLLETILPGLNSQALSSRYFGFVTGGVLPAAEAADNMVSALDQNVQVHLPAHSVSTFVEDAALSMLVNLLDLGDPADWPACTFTTGATGSNIMGLACGREAVILARISGSSSTTVAEMGLLAACQVVGIREIQILTSMGHSSLSKAASLVGLGHAAVRDLGVRDEPWRLDLDAVERELAREGVASIIVVSAGEVNTGRFALRALDMPKLRSLADRHGAWIHVDGAFGIFARALPKTEEFLHLHAGVAGLELADSITADGHKLLNVPYDCGIFLCRNATIVNQVFRNPNAAYLASAAPGSVAGTATTIHSPLNIGIENSRRFRALPVYAVLRSEGCDGLAAMFTRMVLLARGIAAFIRDSDAYDWLPDQSASLEQTHIVVLFRAKNPRLNEVLADRINETRRMFVSGSSWEGRKAIRIAVGSWRVDVERDLAVVKEVLSAAASSFDS